jgi:ubiquinone/menaquinone biosynthesis C-methylase UbiE
MKKKPQVHSNLYAATNYDGQWRFNSYWHQIKWIRFFNPKNILEIGIGTGFISNYLNRYFKKITTIDIDPQLNPDIVGSVTSLPFRNHCFELIACYEVLEHIPFEYFATALKEISRVTRKYAIISVPDVNRAFRIYFDIPGWREFKKTISIPWIKAPRHEFDGQHYWEIGKREYELNRINNAIKGEGFVITKSYRLFEWHYHRFFILEKL